MVDVQDGDAQSHKRTAIPQLLNPVSTAPTKRQEHHPHANFRGTFQHPSLSPAARSGLTRSDSSPPGRPPFHLRAAQWEPTDPAPPNAVHYTSSPETNGNVRERSASHPAYSSGPRPNNNNGYTMTASINQVFCHPQVVHNPQSPPQVLEQPPIIFHRDGRAGECSYDFELKCHSLIVQGA
jgi:hypothetical protein